MENKAELDLIEDCQNFIGKDIQELSTKKVYHIYALEIRNCEILATGKYENKAVAVINKKPYKWLGLKDIQMGFLQKTFVFV